MFVVKQPPLWILNQVQDDGTAALAKDAKNRTSSLQKFN